MFYCIIITFDGTILIKYYLATVSYGTELTAKSCSCYNIHEYNFNMPCMEVRLKAQLL